ncbi:hypothetical protein ABT116_37970, partial [Streptomyces sp. NPDC002130]
RERCAATLSVWPCRPYRPTRPDLPGEWRLGFFGLPILKGAAAWFVGRVLDEKVEMDDHVAVLHEPETSRAPGEIVTFADVRGLDPGYDA